MFDLSIYTTLLQSAEFLIIKKYRKQSISFAAGDLVHNLYLSEKDYTLKNYFKDLNVLLKKEMCSGVNFIIQHHIFEDTYVCCKCKEPKPVASFRLRIEKRECYFDYINNMCIECEVKAKREYDSLHKEDLSYKEKAKMRSKKWHYDNRELVLKYEKNRRQTNEYKAKMKEYREKNKYHILNKAREARKRRKESKQIEQIILK